MSTTTQFRGDFRSADDVWREFNVDPKNQVGVKLLIADYEMEQYKGSAFVLFRRGGKLYEVHGSHCSCYGLEGQWEPEETTKDALEHRLINGSPWYWTGEARDAMAKWLRVKLPARE